MVAKERWLRRETCRKVLVLLGMALAAWAVVAAGAAAREDVEIPSMQAVHFVDSRTGWVAGEGIILATRDGGATWAVQYRGSANVTQLHFVDALHGWAVAEKELLITVDGGERWEAFALPQPEEHPPNFGFWAATRVDFFDATRGWLTDGALLYATEDGGRTWRPLVTPVLAKAACRTGDAEGWVASEEGIYVTQDGGATWTLRFAPDLIEYWWRVDMECAGDRLWVLYRGEVSMNQMAYVAFTSADGGRTWRPALAQFYFGDAYPGIDRVPSIYAQAGPFVAPTERTAYFVGFCAPCDAWVRLAVTRDGGETWGHPEVPNFWYYDAGLFFLDEDHGWIVGSRIDALFSKGGGVLYETRDGGWTWREIPLAILAAEASAAGDAIPLRN